MPLATEPEVRDYLDGKSVAVVGNSTALIGQGLGEEIDGHDVVLRMNLGHPDLHPEHRKHLGNRADILTLGRYWPKWFASIRFVKWVWWMKLTPTGYHDLPLAMLWFKKSRWWDWPVPLEAEVKQYVGSDPSTGVRVCYFLSSIPGTKVDIYGMDCWSRSQTSFWSDRKPAIAHVPDLELAALTRMGFKP